MSLRTLETAIINEVREITGRRKLRLKDLLEWSTTPIKDVRDGEETFHCPLNHVYVAIPKAAPKGGK